MNNGEQARDDAGSDVGDRTGRHEGAGEPVGQPLPGAPGGGPCPASLKSLVDRLPSPPAWPLGRRSAGRDYFLFRARIEQRQHPRSGRWLPRVVLESRDWVNVVALTEAGEVILVRQFRFGTAAVTTELPAGMVEAGEAPLAAAQRELLEETGFAAARWRSLGSVAPNPAFLDNRCHLFLAEGCRLVAEQRLDGGEDIALAFWPLEQVREAVRLGVIDHSLVVCAISRLEGMGAGPDAGGGAA